MAKSGRERRKKIRLSSKEGWAESFQGAQAGELPERAKITDISESGVKLEFAWPKGPSFPLQHGDNIGFRLRIAETKLNLEVWSIVRRVKTERTGDRVSVGVEFVGLEKRLQAELQRGMLSLAVVKLRPEGAPEGPVSLPRTAPAPRPKTAPPKAAPPKAAPEPAAPAAKPAAPAAQPSPAPPPAAAPESAGIATRGRRRRRYLGEILVQQGMIDAARLKEFLERRFTGKAPLGQELLRSGLVDDVAVAKALAEQYSLPYMDLVSRTPSATLAAKLPKDAFIRHTAVPVAEDGRAVLVAASGVLAPPDADEIQTAIGRRARLGIAPENRIIEWLWRLYNYRVEAQTPSLPFAARLEVTYRFLKRDGIPIGEGPCTGETRGISREELVLAGPLPEGLTPEKIGPESLRIEVLVKSPKLLSQVLLVAAPMGVKPGEKSGQYVLTCRITSFPRSSQAEWERICMVCGTHRFRSNR